MLMMGLEEVSSSNPCHLVIRSADKGPTPARIHFVLSLFT